MNKKKLTTGVMTKKAVKNLLDKMEEGILHNRSCGLVMTKEEYDLVKEMATSILTSKTYE